MRRMHWRSPVAPEQARGFAPWLAALRQGQHNGVYLIRDVETGELLYVGESHRRRLYETRTRHLSPGNGRGAGPSYAPGFVEVAVLIASLDDDPVAEQYALIQQLRPRDNVLDGRTLFEKAPHDEVPF